MGGGVVVVVRCTTVVDVVPAVPPLPAPAGWASSRTIRNACIWNVSARPAHRAT
ncbi:MAG: hypothetical protein LC733_11190 [Actinobacteria bacterium]|nr:hypothetical protein [Actinomycetota bacterium]